MSRNMPSISDLKWPRIQTELNEFGCARVGAFLTSGECDALVRGYDDEAAFRSRVVMAQHAFGRGEYKYYAYPLPPLIAKLRRKLYPPLAEIANDWETR